MADRTSLENDAVDNGALWSREEELSLLVDMVPSHLWRLTDEGEPSFFNKRMVDFIGFSADDLESPGRSKLDVLIDCIHEDDAKEFGSTLRRCIATGEVFAMRYRIRRADGAFHWMSSRAEPMRDRDGRIIQWYGLCHDIHDQVIMEEALRRSESQLRRLVDSNIIGIVTWDLNGQLLDANDAFLNMVQYSRDEFEKGFSWLDLTPPEWQEAHALQEAQELANTGLMQPREKEFFRKDGGRVPVLIGAACFEGQRRQGVAYILDLTERKHAELELRKRERELEQLVDTVPVQLWSVSAEGHAAYINKTMKDYMGLHPRKNGDEPGLAETLKSSVHPNDRLLYLDKITNSVETGEKFEHKFRNRRWDGEYRWTQGYANPLRDEEGNIIRWYGANIDIHDQEVSQNELREKERFLSRLVETLPAMVDCAAPNGEPVYRSQQLREFLGYELEELDSSGKSRLAATLDTSVHPDDLAVVKKRYSQCLSSGEPYAHKHRLQRFDGEYRWVETRAVPMHNTASEIVQWNVICIDIDSEVRAQEALRLAQERLFRASQTASLAELSASIAHEVNQPLAAVVANSYACHRWLSATPVNLERAKQTAERLIRDANTASDIVNRIKALFKHSADERILTDIGNIISEARALLAGDALRHQVEILVEGEFGLPQLMVDRTQILQVLVNLMRNAIEAMEGSQYGRVLRINAVPTNAGVRIEISDLGIGLTEFENIFEPFVSAKINGMGMGLAICRSIVEGHGGRLSAEPNQPKGAKFIINLPTGL